MGMDRSWHKSPKSVTSRVRIGGRSARRAQQYAGSERVRALVSSDVEMCCKFGAAAHLQTRKDELPSVKGIVRIIRCLSSAVLRPRRRLQVALKHAPASIAHQPLFGCVATCDGARICGAAGASQADSRGPERGKGWRNRLSGALRGPPIRLASHLARGGQRRCS